MLKDMKWRAVIVSCLLIVLGIVLIVYPEVSASIVADVIGFGLIAYGLIDIIIYFFADITNIFGRDEFLTGVIAAVFGLVVIFKREMIMSLVPVILGMVIMISGINKIQDAIIARRIGYTGAGSYTVLGLISIAAGVAISFFLSGQTASNVLFRIIGAGLIYCGISDLYTTLFVTKKFHEFARAFRDAKAEMEGNTIDVEASVTSSEEITDQETEN